MDFEGGAATVYAPEEGGFDPTEIPQAVKDAGFGPGEIGLRVTGALARWEELPALALPGRPPLLILGGGDALASLLDAELAAGSLLWVRGALHPSHAGKPAGMTVEEWRLADSDR